MRDSAIVIARLIFAIVFAIAAWFKFTGMAGTAQLIASVGFPAPLTLAWLAALFETALALALLTGAWFRQAALIAAAYVLFLGVTFHGPSHWAGNKLEMGLFIDHFTFIAGLLLAAVVGPGTRVLFQPRRSATDDQREIVDA